ncbi:catalytic/coenzyme binding protein [Gossypium australe]|uniref:Catalytic/coenzyme binding protein n=1 Tax=Gossypium australe TaxID=47621 RepID=A0A5B6X6S4_9ROSI|nr:catalytic/coenzyme binding protein [Gossypium australe]
MATRLIYSRLSLSRLSAMGGPKNGRFLSTESNKIDEPFKVEEAETVNVPPPPSEKLLVLGGNGFVGSHICREALNCGLAVASLSRSGGSSLHDSWAKNVTWHKGNLLSSDSWKEALDGVTSVISCIGGFGSNSYMYKINGTANINAIRAAADKGVKRFVYISAADFGLANYLLKGYYEGKISMYIENFYFDNWWNIWLKKSCGPPADGKFSFPCPVWRRELLRQSYSRSFRMEVGVILRPGFIHGTRTVGSMKLPLGVIGSPLEMVLQHAKPLNQLPLVGPLFTPPVNVTAVAKVAVRAATDPVFPPGIVDVYGIQRFSQQMSR